MSESIMGKVGIDCIEWDESILVTAYDSAAKLGKEDLAKLLATNTNKLFVTKDTKQGLADNATCEKPNYKIGDFVRATFVDGIDYEAKIIGIDAKAKKATLKYIGYDNNQEVLLSDLVDSWGKQVRRSQYMKAKNVTTPTENRKKKKDNVNSFKYTVPPPQPPLVQMTSAQSPEEYQHFSAMLMSWYMSGYYTGVYQGIQMANSKRKNKKENEKIKDA